MASEQLPCGCRRGHYGWEPKCGEARQLWDDLVAARAAVSGAGTCLVPVADARAAYERHFEGESK